MRKILGILILASVLIDFNIICLSDCASLVDTFIKVQETKSSQDITSDKSLSDQSDFSSKHDQIHCDAGHIHAVDFIANTPLMFHKFEGFKLAFMEYKSSLYSFFLMEMVRPPIAA